MAKMMTEDIALMTETADVKAKQPVKILLVDDKQENLLSLEVVLADNSYTFVKANSGKEALKILLNEQDFALILLDVQMPIINGFETAELIRQSDKLKHIPIIFLTATSDSPAHIFKGYQAGAVDYLLKPFDPEILKAKACVFTELYRKNQELKQQDLELKTLNAELRQRTEDLIHINSELEKFAYVASHDMQEPLRTITSFIQLLQVRLSDKLDSETIEFMDFVVNASGRMRSIITDLLEYSRVGRSERPFEEVDCDEVLEEVLSNLKTGIEEHKAKISSDKLPVIYGNHVQIIQLFQNLIGNAIKFKSERDLEIKIRVEVKDDDYLFSVQDNGIGIQQEYTVRVFEIFQRLHTINTYSGTGIGLAICKKIVEKHRGKIWLESTPGQGTTFYFTIKRMKKGSYEELLT